MTVFELFLAMFKLILKGKGKYKIYAMFDGWTAGVFMPNETDEKLGRVCLW